MAKDRKERKAPRLSIEASQEVEEWLSWHEERARQIVVNLQSLPIRGRPTFLENLIRHWRGGYRVIKWLRAQNRRGRNNGQ